MRGFPKNHGPLFAFGPFPICGDFRNASVTCIRNNSRYMVDPQNIPYLCQRKSEGSTSWAAARMSPIAGSGLGIYLGAVSYMSYNLNS